MSADKRAYDWRGTKASWRKWKKALKRSLARARRREDKKLEDAQPRVTAGWTR